MLKRILISIILAVSLLSLLTPPAYAGDTQEDPDAVKTIFSYLALMMFYSDSLDPILQKDIESTEKALNKMPFVNVPEELNQPTSEFSASGITLSHSIVSLFNVWEQENTLINQYRLGEAKTLGKQIREALPQAYQQLAKLKTAAEDTGLYIKVKTLAPDNALRQSYDEVMAKIEQLKSMLDLLARPLMDLQDLSPEQLNDLLRSSDLNTLAEMLGINADQLNQLINSNDMQRLLDLLKTVNPEIFQQVLKKTDLILEVQPTTAYVGETVDFWGSLATQGEALAGRSIDLLINSSVKMTLATDSEGHFQGTFQIPYQYNHTLEVQAVYYPQAKDIGIYLGSASPVINMNILYYEANLLLEINNPAYPGRQSTLTARFDYGTAPPVERENSELYIDDTLLSHFTAPSEFTRSIQIESTAKTGNHIVTLTAPAKGRYAPAYADCIMDIKLATVQLDMGFPWISLMPGHIGLTGRAYSELGSLENADVNITMEKDFLICNTGQNGTIATRLNLELELSLLGSRAMVVSIQPREPWNAPLVITRNVFLINWVGLGILLEFLALMYVTFLPVKGKKDIRKKVVDSKSLAEESLQPEIAPNYSVLLAEQMAEMQGEEANTRSIVKWYRLVFKLAQRTTNSILKPQQTLREYAKTNSQKLGPISRYFYEFTLIIEKLLYSKHKLDHKDMEKSKELSQTIYEETKHENV